MRILMKRDAKGTANAAGSRVMLYRAGRTYDMDEAWQDTLARLFVSLGWAVRARRKATRPGAGKAFAAAPENKALESAPEDKGRRRKKG